MTTQSFEHKKWRCIVYFHGGGCVIHSAAGFVPFCNRIAYETQSIVINCNYRLCPEAKFPLPAFDAFAIFKNIVAEAESLGVDRDRIVVAGDSAGACLAMNVGKLLADRNEQALARLLVLIHPMIGNHFVSGKVPESEWTTCERNFVRMQRSFYQHMSTDFDAQKDDPLIYPCTMDAATLLKLPPTAIFTGEFDAFRRDADAFAARLASVGRLADFCIHPGLNHDAPVAASPESERLSQFWTDLATLI